MATLLSKEDFGPDCVDLERLVPDGSIVRIVTRREFALGISVDYEVKTLWIDPENKMIRNSYGTRFEMRPGETARFSITGWGPALPLDLAEIAADNIAAAVRIAGQRTRLAKP